MLVSTLGSDIKICMRYVISDPDPDVGDSTRETMGITFTASWKGGVVDLVFPNESGVMVGAQSVVCITQYNMIVNYDLKGYSNQAVLLDEHHTLMDDSVEDVYDYIVLKFKTFPVEDG